MIVTQREREREAETQAEGGAGSMHWEPDVGFDPGPKAGAKPLRHPGIPTLAFLIFQLQILSCPPYNHEISWKYQLLESRGPCKGDKTPLSG